MTMSHTVWVRVIVNDYVEIELHLQRPSNELILTTHIYAVKCGLNNIRQKRITTKLRYTAYNKYDTKMAS